MAAAVGLVFQISEREPPKGQVLDVSDFKFKETLTLI